MRPAPDALDLRQFAPPAGVTVTLASGQSYTFPGDPDTDDVARMLRLEEAMSDTDGLELAENIEEAKGIISRMALQADPSQDVAAMKVGSSELVILFALLLHGATVADAVGRALVASETTGEPGGDPDADEEPASPLGAPQELPASA